MFKNIERKQKLIDDKQKLISKKRANKEAKLRKRMNIEDIEEEIKEEDIENFESSMSWLQNS